MWDKCFSSLPSITSFLGGQIKADNFWTSLLFLGQPFTEEGLAMNTSR